MEYQWTTGKSIAVSKSTVRNHGLHPLHRLRFTHWDLAHTNWLSKTRWFFKVDRSGVPDGSSSFQFHMFHRVHESFFCAGCITCAAAKSCSSPVRWAIRLSGFSGWMACPVFNCCSFSGNAATLFPSFSHEKMDPAGDFGGCTCWIGMSVLIAFSFGRAYPHGSAAPRSVLVEQLKPGLSPRWICGFSQQNPPWICWFSQQNS